MRVGKHVFALFGLVCGSEGMVRMGNELYFGQISVVASMIGAVGFIWAIHFATNVTLI